MIEEGKLEASPHTRGRYAVRVDDDYAPELSSGQSLMVKLGGQWVAGRVEHGARYASEIANSRTVRGYYFIADDGSVCGLCVGMTVRV